MADEAAQSEILKMATEIVAAYVGQNSVATEQMPDVIAKVYGSLQALNAGDGTAIAEPLEPAVSIRRSTKPDYLVCLEDGKKLKMLKRHLRTDHNLTPEEYRARWGLRADYPMIAPNYVKQRSQIAKRIGLGRKPGYRPKRSGG
jgi:predicted transcriptional regulator